MLDDVLAVKRHGLITLERARLLTGSAGPVALAEQVHDATKLTVYVGRQERAAGVPAFVAICDLLHRRGIAGATVLLGVDGTVHGVRRRARFFGRNADVPMMIVAIGSGARIAAVLPEIEALLTRPLLTLERVRVCKRDGELLARPTPLPRVDDSGLGLWQKLMVYSSERARDGNLPLHVSLVRRLRVAGAAGATCAAGHLGVSRRPRPARRPALLQLRRRVPVVTIDHRHAGADRRVV